jgi:hypothetical protein
MMVVVVVVVVTPRVVAPRWIVARGAAELR